MSMAVRAGIVNRRPSCSVTSSGGMRRREKRKPGCEAILCGAATQIRPIGACAQKDARAAAPVSSTASG